MSADTLLEAGARQGGDLRGFTSPPGVVPLDLSTCVNRFGPHPDALPAVATIRPDELRGHPYWAAEAFLDAYAEFLGGVCADDLLPLRGITEGLRIIAALDPRAVIVCPDYTESIRLFEHFPGSGHDTVAVRGRRVADAMAQHPHGTVVLSNPCNPLGLHIPAAQLAAIADAYPDTQLVVDEAYADFLPVRDTLLGVPLPNVAVLRAPNKILGMAGVRTGALWTGNPTLARAVADQLLTWPIGTVDSVMAIAALRAPKWITATRTQILTTAARMNHALTGLFDSDVLDSPCHFRFVRRDDRAELQRLRTHLAEHHISVRVFPTAEPARVPGMRIVAPTAAEWPQLEHALSAFGTA